MQLLTGKSVRESFEPNIASDVEAILKTGIPPCLAMILVGNHAESETYVGTKSKTAERLKIGSIVKRLPEDIDQADLIACIESLNADASVHGILCQMPLPAHLDSAAASAAIAPEKDVDCLHPYNTGLLTQNMPRFLPCTPWGILGILDHYGISVSGRAVTVLGRSNIVGRPISILLSAPGRDGVVTISHSKAENQQAVLQQADILVTAIGNPNFVTPDMVKEGVVIIDVGINRVKDETKEKGYRICGDVNPAVQEIASAFTPVPGGVGVMTVTMLMANTVKAYHLQNPAMR